MLGRKFKIKVLVDFVPNKDSLPALSKADFSACPYMYVSSLLQEFLLTLQLAGLKGDVAVAGVGVGCLS